jgi:hypothetical protein
MILIPIIGLVLTLWFGALYVSDSFDHLRRYKQDRIRLGLLCSISLYILGIVVSAP